MWFVYVLLCADQSLYTGITNNIDERLKEHKLGKGGSYTRSHKAVKIVYTQRVGSKSLALRREAEIKRMRRQQKIQTLRLSF